MRIHRLSVALTAMALLTGLPSRGAAEAADPVEEEIVEEMIVRGIRTGMLAPSPSTFTTEIDLDAFEGEHKTLEALLAQSVGVQVRRFGGEGERSEVSIRGSTTSQVVVLVDGVRMNSEQSGAVDLSTFPVDLIQRIEILRGGGGAQEGSGAMGGVINLVTRRPSAEPVTRFDFSGGSFGTWQGSLFHSRALGPLESTLGYSGFKTDGDYFFVRPIRIDDDTGTVFPGGCGHPIVERVNNRREKHSLSATAGSEIGATGYLKLSQSLYYGSQGEPGLDVGCGPLAGQRLEAHQREFRSMTLLRWTGQDPTPLRGAMEASASYRFERRDFEDNAIPVFDSEQDLSAVQADVSDTWEGAHEWLGMGVSHAVTARMDGRYDALEANDQSDPSRYTIGLSGRGTLGFRNDAILLTPALRFDWTEGFGDHWLPSLGLRWTTLDWLRLQANIARTFRVPSFEELYFPNKGYIRGNPNLDPEEGLNSDVGFVAQFDAMGVLGETRLEASYFHNRVEESIVWMLVGTGLILPLNTGPATIQGTELGLSLSPATWLIMSTNYTFTNATRDRSGDPLPGRAPHEVNARIELRSTSVWKLVGEYHYTGRFPVSTGGAAWMEPQNRWDATAALNLAAIPPLVDRTSLSRLWLSFQALNIADAALRDAQFSPQPGRSLRLGVEGRW